MKLRKLLAVSFGLSTLVAASSALCDDQLAFAKQKGCTNCHAVDKKLIGPSYKDVAAKYKGDAGAADRLAEKVISGGKGVWGPIPMPPNKVTPEESKMLVEWVLSI